MESGRRRPHAVEPSDEAEVGGVSTVSEDSDSDDEEEEDEAEEELELEEAAKSAARLFSALGRCVCTPAMSARRYTELARIAVPDASSNAPSSSA